MLSPLLLPVGEYLPDQPDYAGTGSAVCRNAVPRTADSYTPMPSMATFSSNGLGGRCQGAIATLDSAGTVALFAGSAADLYKLAAGGVSFANFSKSAGVYVTATDGRWSFAQFGQNLYAANFADTTQSVDITLGSAFADVAAAPKAKYLAAVKNFMVAGFTNDGTIHPQRTHWSAFNDPTSWPTAGSSAAQAVQSDYQDHVGDHGWLQGIVPNLGFADAALFFERAVYRMQYTGAPYFFSFAPAEKVRGTPAPGSIVQLGAMVYYLGEDGFYAFDGAASQPIGALKIDKTFFADLDQNYFDRISGACDPINKTIYWAYPGIGNAGGLCNRIVAYHTVLNRFGLIYDQPTEILWRALTSGYSLESLSALYPNLDTLVPFSLDSRIWSAGRPILGGFDGTTHKLGLFSGPNLAVTLDTPEQQPFAGRRALVTSARPIGDLAAPSVAIATRDRTQDTPSYGGASAMNAQGECPQRVDGRHVRARITTAAAASGTHISGVALSARPSSVR